ncbi:triose-phosphate isomerase [Oceanibacterium hippocampi]|uniref:Triosephosphate isomerase n=1 Tax=Oceanibacterium hippocampi TaxID=745714 RepID=A0A1Y5T238_9PROT|nr:triose-phosphate isomerase [Oceanibacterium hippocampi]SLN54359.1 Triosephosphate isomerase [Oceanibacterium hippocampi]
MSDGRQPVIAGNWKMNGRMPGATATIADLAARLATRPGAACAVVICPPAPLLPVLREILGANSRIALGGQDCHAGTSGAHTGDVAAEMLADAGAAYCIVGHSERRADHGEDDRSVAAKAVAAHRAGLTAIVCVGETLAEREAGRALDIVAGQLDGSLPDGATPANTIIAYEPVWAIGTGRTPTTDDVAAMHRHMRAHIAKRDAALGDCRLLYGGSVKAANAAELMAVADVDGALVGGASLAVDDFWPIIETCL